MEAIYKVPAYNVATNACPERPLFDQASEKQGIDVGPF